MQSFASQNIFSYNYGYFLRGWNLGATSSDGKAYRRVEMLQATRKIVYFVAQKTLIRGMVYYFCYW
jgi:hypothetical protein